ncbi:metallophosphoesterase [Solirubrobacter taibaiensis]|nr:metallophosphoesterase [Solirubrobacter taibaiensis]
MLPPQFEPDREALRRVREQRPRRLLVASDFHLGAGSDQRTGTYDATENFHADDAFADWLEHYGATDTVLILNGDIFDFVRVTAVPVEEADCERWSQALRRLGYPEQASSPARLKLSVSRSERRYGLGSEDYKSLWKLLHIIDGHPGFFAALSRWIERGGEVVILAGNHDVELHWPLVRQAIRLEVRQPEGGPWFEDEDVRFENVQIEHGHQYDPMNRVQGSITLAPDNTQMRLPLGSFLCRYMINRVEALDPFIDNVKPAQDALLRLVRQVPFRTWRAYGGGWRFVFRAIAMRRMNTAVALIALTLTLPPIVLALLLVPPPLRDATIAQLDIGHAGRAAVAFLVTILFGGALPYVIGAINDLRRRRFPPRNRQLEAARTVVARVVPDRGPAYVCMGHTHEVAVERLNDEGSRLYINTGTWTALWPRDRPDLLGRTQLTYACFDARTDGYIGAVLRWDEHGRRPVPAKILIKPAHR